MPQWPPLFLFALVAFALPLSPSAVNGAATDTLAARVQDFSEAACRAGEGGELCDGAAAALEEDDDIEAESMRKDLLQLQVNRSQARAPGGSCAQYQCGKYRKSQECQCNAECKDHESCCSDYSVTCPNDQGSCQQYGCGSKYEWWKLCQCNDACKKYGSCCPDHEALCTPEPTPAPTPQPPTIFDGPSGPKKTVYHQTSLEVCKLIMDTEFKIGHGGWCGKAIYFAVSPEDTRTKAITARSNEGCMIEAVVDLGRQKRYNSCGAYNSMNKGKLNAAGYDTIVFNPGDGDEIIIFDSARVLSKKIIPYKTQWAPVHRRRRR